METLDLSQAINAEAFDSLAAPGMYKRALDATNDFVRTRVREASFREKILPSLPITYDELDRQVSTDKPYKVVDKEPDSPGAMSIPFGSLPKNWYIRGLRFPVMFDRIVSHRFLKDVVELGTWNMDIRQVVSDNSVKDMLAEDDAKFIAAVKEMLGGAPETVLPWSGQAQWTVINGGINRDTYQEMLKVMPDTDASLETQTILCNHITYKELGKWRRDEMGGDFSQSVLKDGAVDEEFNKKKWVVTIKKKLVPTDTVFMFADPKFLGKFFDLEQTCMYIKREAFMLEFFAYRTAGGTIGHGAGLACVEFR